MLKTRVIPVLLLKDGAINKPVQFRRARTVANPMAIVRVFESRQVDELVLLDIGCAEFGETVNADLVRSLADELSVPFAVGGGIRSLATMVDLIKNGAEKVVINTAAFENPEIIAEAAAVLGRQCIVVSIDAARRPDGGFEVFTHNGKQATGVDPAKWAKQASAMGAGEILLTSIDQDGTMEGFDLQLVQSVTAATSVPVIACGGAGSLDDFVHVVRQGRASAVAAGSIFHFRRTTPNMVKEALRNAGVPVRASYVRGT